VLTQPGKVSKDELFAILADPTQAGVDEALPDTGLSREWETAAFVPLYQHGRLRNPLFHGRHGGNLRLPSH